MNKRTLISQVLTSLSLVTGLLACAPQPVTQPGAVSVNNPIPLISLGVQKGAQINVGVGNRGGFITQAASVALTSADIKFYMIDLIQDQPGSSLNSANYGMSVAGAIHGFKLAGPASGTITNGASLVTPDGGAVGRFAFTNVLPGAYRIRVKASKDADAAAASPVNDISAPDNFFIQNSGWEISDGTATVNLGSSTVTYAGPGSSVAQLDIMLKLRDPGDDVVGNIIVTPGGSMVGARDI